MNVGPTADGRIVPIFEERLRQMGRLCCGTMCVEEELIWGTYYIE